ncbi:MAG TPA: DUF5591 domain-containing protein, partial [Candidatus Glassbacteria bacterium]|nr:DUF5591 domain-containing protein [Candidatus Glassbacteria bacterium]
KQAIREGRLWELVEMRTHAHPALFSAVKKIKEHAEFIEKFSPAVKKRGFFFFSSVGLTRPEVLHYRNQLLKNYQPPTNSKILLLLSQTHRKPYHNTREYKKVRRIIRKKTENLSEIVHVCFYAAPFGIIPIELDEVYPLSQNEATTPFDSETKDYIATLTSEYIKNFHYKTVILLNDNSLWDNKIVDSCKKTCSIKKIQFIELEVNTGINKDILACLENILKKQMSD